jgi:predicted RNA-binding protein YlqC (UPF0109 family)
MLKKPNGTYRAQELLGDELWNASIGELLLAVVCKLVDRPEEVTAEYVKSDSLLYLQFDVGEGEVGKVMGKEHLTIHSIRTLAFAMLGAAGGKRRRCDIGVKSQRDDYDSASS